MRVFVRPQGLAPGRMAETAQPDPGLADRVAATLQGVTKLRGQVNLVSAGSLPNDGKVISDERPAG